MLQGRVWACGLAILLLSPWVSRAVAQEQPSAPAAAPQARWVVEAGAGFQTYYRGDLETLAVGITPTRSLTFLVSAQRSHVRDRTEVYEDGASTERGSTERFVSGEFRYTFLPGRRISPFVLGGIGGGRSTANVSAAFPDTRRRDIAVFYYGGGGRIPVRPWLDAVVDARFIWAAEATSDYLAVRLPVRAGVAFRF